MTINQAQLISLIRYSVLGQTLPEDFSINASEELFDLAKRHDCTHLAAYAIQKNHLLKDNEETSKHFQQQYYSAVRRVVVLENEIAKIKAVFEKNKIEFIPLKGTVIRRLYPEQWMRVSADIDMLVKSEELGKAEEALINELNYNITNEGAHHDHVTAPSGFHVDLHFTLNEQNTQAKPFLDEVWERSHRIEETKQEHLMDDDMFYLFHMFHAAAHFQLGGCGIKPVLDTWILNHRIEFDFEKRKKLLEEAGLLKFAKVMETIAETWFSGEENSRMEDVEDYILTGGVYGGTHRIAAGQAKSGGRIQYVLNRAFPPYSSIKNGYPVLKKYPVLLPFCWIHRLVQGLFTGKSKLAKYEMKKTKEEEKHSQEIREMFNRLFS